MSDPMTPSAADLRALIEEAKVRVALLRQRGALVCDAFKPSESATPDCATCGYSEAVHWCKRFAALDACARQAEDREPCPNCADTGETPPGQRCSEPCDCRLFETCDRCRVPKAAPLTPPLTPLSKDAAVLRELRAWLVEESRLWSGTLGDEITEARSAGRTAQIRECISKLDALTARKAA